MKIAYSSAAEMLKFGASSTQADPAKKPQVAFAGSMRMNLVSMRDEIGLDLDGISTGYYASHRRYTNRCAQCVTSGSEKHGEHHRR